MTARTLAMLSFLTLMTITSAQTRDWTVFIYMDGMEELHDAALRNINDLASHYAGDNAHIVVQMNAYDTTALRYRIENNTIIQEDSITITQDYHTDITNAAQWAYAQHPADNHALIFWGHGKGILRPTWDPTNNGWFVEHDTLDTKHGCSEKNRACLEQHCLNYHRANLLNNSTQKCLDNCDMIQALTTITDTILNKKLDILILDLCLGASIEQAYQVAPFTHYFIATESCQMKEGLNYASLAEKLSLPCTPCQLAQSIGRDYQLYYAHTNTDDYTLSVIDCTTVSTLFDCIDDMCEALNDYIANNSGIIGSLRSSIAQSEHFCFIPMYRDLYTLSECIKQCAHNDASSQAQMVIDKAHTVQSALCDSVIVNTCGDAMQHAHGLTIYTPCYHIDSSYPTCPYAQDRNWLRFLQTLTQEAL